MPEQHGAGQRRPLETLAECSRITGFGSFGPPPTLIERLKRILANFENGVPGGNPLSGASSRHRVAQSLLQRLTAQLQVPSQPLAAIQDRVTGFYLYRECGKIKIRVLTPRGWSTL